jgi:hypothetical protein
MVSHTLTPTAAGLLLLLCLWVMFVVIKDNATALGQIVVGGTHAIGKLVTAMLTFALMLAGFVLGLYLLLVLIKFLWRLA